MPEIIVRTWNEKDSLALRDGALILSRLGKDRMIPVPQVVSFDVEDPKGKMRPGTITIRLSGAASLEDRVSSVFNIAGGNGVTFNHGLAYLDAARKMQQAIADYLSRPAQAPAQEGQVVSVVDEIRGLKGLLDDGILTQEEFDAKKKQLLGL